MNVSDQSPVAAWPCGRSLVGDAGSDPAGGMDCLSCDCCVLLGREVNASGVITRPEESYRVWCKASTMKRPWVIGVFFNFSTPVYKCE